MPPHHMGLLEIIFKTECKEEMRPIFYFYSHIWGWASWRRAWNSYDFNLKQLEVFKEKQLIKTIDNRKSFKDYWISIFEKTAIKEIDTWDYQWTFAFWINKGVTVLPNVNLISNIGFGKDATHTNGESSFANMKTQDITTILHPKKIKVDSKADRYTSDKVYNIPITKKLTFKYLKKYLEKLL